VEVLVAFCDEANQNIEAHGGCFWFKLDHGLDAYLC